MLYPAVINIGTNPTFQHEDRLFVEVHLLDALDHVLIFGPPGLGKTTLAQHLNGLLQPDRGRILLDGAGATLTEDLGVYVYSNVSGPLSSLTVKITW